MSRFLLFDTETTDLVKTSLTNEANQPKVIEFYGCLCDDEGAIIRELDLLINPGFPLTDEIIRITGIKDDDLLGKPSFRDVCGDIASIIEDATHVVAHNLMFDFGVVSIEMKRAGRAIQWPMGRICTVEETEHLKGTRLKLVDLHTHLFGEPFASAHRAKNDVMAMHRCFFHMRKENLI